MLVFAVHDGEPTKLLNDFRKQTGITYPMLLDRRNTRGSFAYPPGVGYPYPRDVVIDKKLRVRDIKNSFNVKEMDKLVQKLLAE